MFKAYMRLLLKRREFIFSFLFMTAVSLGLFLYNCFTQYGADIGVVLSADKLFIGRQDDNPLYIVLQFIIPLIIVLPFSDIASFEKSANINPIILTRAGRKAYFRSQLLVAGISSWFVVFLPFMLNFILCVIAFPLHSVNTSTFIVDGIYGGYYGSYLDKTLYPELFSVNPYLYNFIFLILLCSFCSLCAMLVYIFSYFLRGNRILLTFILFLVNNLLIAITSRIGYSVAPFEYLFSFSAENPKFGLFLPILFALMIIFIVLLAPKCEKRLCELR